MLRRSDLKFIFIVTTLAFLYYFNVSRTEFKSETQLQYEAWLQNIAAGISVIETEEDLAQLKDKVDSLFPKVEVKLSTKIDQKDFLLRFNSAEEDITASEQLPERLQRKGAQTLRLLKLLSQANIFSLKPGTEQNAELVKLLVKDKNHEFHASFDRDSIESNAQAQLMLKLLQLYSKSDEK